MSTSPPRTLEPHGLELLRTYGGGFSGREAELAALDRAWDETVVRVFALHAEGGAGKTRVLVRWLARMRDNGWRGAGGVFVHSFYSEGSDEVSSQLFFEKALDYFGHAGSRLTDPTEQGRTLARLLVEKHGLLILEGLEALQHPPSFDQGQLKDPAIHYLLLSLTGRTGALSGPTPGGLCVATSRQPIQELQDKIGQTVVQQPLNRLNAEAGAKLLRQLEVRGPEWELHQAVEDSHGHAYSLMLIGTYLRDATDDHDIRRRHAIPLLDQDKEHRYHARHLFGAYVKRLRESTPEVAVLRLLGFFDRTADEKLLAVLRESIEPDLQILTAPLRNLSEADWCRVLRRLTDLRLIDVPVSPSPPIDSHPLLREYFAKQLQAHFTKAWQAGHRLLFEHLCETTEDQPATLIGLQPLYQAVAHGCLAGLHEQARADVYEARILRGTKGAGSFYAMRQLGAMGADLRAVACFFITPWTTITPNVAPIDQAWLLNEAGYRLRALGRLNEAVVPMRAALKNLVLEKDWKHASGVAGNLSELEIARGELQAAIAVAEQAVKYADNSGNLFLRRINRTTLADALHQAGRRGESRSLFENAEYLQAEDQPTYPQLYSLWGFRYCDLLLSDAEYAKWHCYLLAPLIAPAEVCASVRDRALKTLGWITPNKCHIEIALDHLTLARTALYSEQSGIIIPHAAISHAAAAIAGLRVAGFADYLARGLLTRAWLHFISADKLSCQADLDEAWEITERGPMPLLQADILLYRARLFHDRTALTEARRLIEKHGYHRRNEELADAEEAAKGWPETPANRIRAIESPQPATEPKVSDGGMIDQVFISYSHHDERFMEELRTHLKPFLRSGSVTTWSDQQIAPGLKWFDEIQAARGRTSVAVLLVSPDFLASDFIHEHELGPLLKEAESGGVRILWVPIRPSAYEETPLKHLQAASPPDEPLSAKNKTDRDEAWVLVCKEIKRAVNP
jgi:hypothetical protein